MERCSTRSMRRTPLSPIKYNIQIPLSTGAKKRPDTIAKSVEIVKDISPSKKKKENCPAIVRDQGQVRDVSDVSPMLLSPFCHTKRRILCISQTPSPKLSLLKHRSARYSDVKKMLHTSVPDRLLCREKEIQQIKSFVESHLKNREAGSLYVSGAPGTGKTAVIKTVMKEYVEKESYVISLILNCMTIKNPQAICTDILSALTDRDVNIKSMKQASKQLVQRLTSPGPMVVVVLDEIDQVASKNHEILYSMFEWPALDKSRLILIGVANALDLTDRILPRLQARPKCKPQLLNFAPYSKDEIVTILKDRLQTVDDVVDAAALQFCARKVASVAGDMRKALDVCRWAVERFETQSRDSTPPITGARTASSAEQTPTGSALVRSVNIAQMAAVVSDVRTCGSGGRDDVLPLQQKITICALLLITKSGKSKEVTIGKLHDIYLSVCRKRHVTGVGQAEFLTMCEMIELSGTFSIRRAKEARMSKIKLKLNEEELEHTLQDRTLMSSILSERLS